MCVFEEVLFCVWIGVSCVVFFGFCKFVMEYEWVIIFIDLENNKFYVILKGMRM